MPLTVLGPTPSAGRGRLAGAQPPRGRMSETFISGLRWVAASRLVGQAISWAGTLYVIRVLAPADYGLAAICSAVISIISMIAEFGFGAAIIQAKTLDKPQIRGIFGASLLFAGALFAGVVVLAPVIAWFFRAPEVAWLVRVSALQLVITALAMLPGAFLARDMSFRLAAPIEIVGGLAGTLTSVGLAMHGDGVWALIVGPLVGAALRTLLLNLASPQPYWPSLNLAPARDLIKFGFQVAMTRVVSYVFVQSDVLIAGRILDKTALGEYSIAMHLAMLPVSKVMGILNAVAYPAIAKMQRDGFDMRPNLLQALRLAGYLLIPLLWGLAAVAPWLVGTVLGPQWTGAIVLLEIVGLVFPLRMIGVLMSSAVQGMGRADIELRNTLTGLLVLPACFLAGANFGAVGLAAGWAVGLPLMIAINVARSRAVLDIGLGQALWALSRPAACAALMVLSVRIAAQVFDAFAGTPAGLAGLIAIGTAVYATAVWTFDRNSALAMLRIVRPPVAVA